MSHYNGNGMQVTLTRVVYMYILGDDVLTFSPLTGQIMVDCSGDHERERMASHMNNCIYELDSR